MFIGSFHGELFCVAARGKLFKNPNDIFVLISFLSKHVEHFQKCWSSDLCFRRWIKRNRERHALLPKLSWRHHGVFKRYENILLDSQNGFASRRSTRISMLEHESFNSFSNVFDLDIQRSWKSFKKGISTTWFHMLSNVNLGWNALQSLVHHHLLTNS